MNASKIGKADELFLVLVRDHRSLVEHQHMVLQRRLCLQTQHRVTRIVEQLVPATKEPGQRLRGYTGVAFEHLDERVLDREPDDRAALVAQHRGDGLQNTAFAGPCNSLDRDRSILGRQDQLRRPELTLVETEPLPCHCSGLDTISRAFRLNCR